MKKSDKFVLFVWGGERLEGRERELLQEEAYQEDVDAFSDRCRQRDDAVRSRDSVQAADEVRQVVLEDWKVILYVGSLTE